MTMTPPGDQRTVYFSDDPDEDTIEMVLSPDDMRTLSRAAEEQQREARLAESTSAAPPTDQPGAPHASPADPPSASGMSSPPLPPTDPAALADPGPQPSDSAVSASTSPPALPPAAARASTPSTPATTTPHPTRPDSTAPSALIDSAAAAPKGATCASQGTPTQQAQARNFAILSKSTLAGAIGALLIVLAISLWHTSSMTTKTAPALEPTAPETQTQSQVPTPAPVATTAATPAIEPPQPAEPLAPGRPLRFKNPFDKSEIFEFPQGTTVAEARQSVANLLLQRARDRRVQAGSPQHTPTNTSPRGRAAKNTDLARNGR